MVILSCITVFRTLVHQQLKNAHHLKESWLHRLFKCYFKIDNIHWGWGGVMCYTLKVWGKRLKLYLAYLPNFFSIWTSVLNHNKYVEIKQFSKEDIKQNNISSVILLIKFLVYQWDPRHLQGSRVVYIFIYNLYSCSI